MSELRSGTDGRRPRIGTVPSSDACRRRAWARDDGGTKRGRWRRSGCAACSRPRSDACSNSFGG